MHDDWFSFFFLLRMYVTLFENEKKTLVILFLFVAFVFFFKKIVYTKFQLCTQYVQFFFSKRIYVQISRYVQKILFQWFSSQCMYKWFFNYFFSKKYAQIFFFFKKVCTNNFFQKVYTNDFSMIFSMPQNIFFQWFFLCFKKYVQKIFLNDFLNVSKNMYKGIFNGFLNVSKNMYKIFSMIFLASMYKRFSSMIFFMPQKLCTKWFFFSKSIYKFFKRECIYKFV